MFHQGNVKIKKTNKDSENICWFCIYLHCRVL